MEKTSQSAKRFEAFLQEFTPKFGPAVLQLVDGIKFESLRDALIAKGILTSKDIDHWEEVEINKLSENLRKVPHPNQVKK